MAEQKKRNVRPKQTTTEVAPTTQTVQSTQPAEVPPTPQVQPAPEQVATVVEGAAKKPRPAKQASNETRYVECAISKYQEKGWQVFRQEKGSLNDFVAHTDKNYHFVQVVTPETLESLRFAGEQRNTFIQNAMSNNATPVHAKVTIETKKNGDPVIGVTFENANTKTRVTVAALRKKAEK